MTTASRNDMFWDRRLKSGYSDFGPIQIPPLPNAILLTDRADGSQWFVSYNPGPPERLSITNDPVTIANLRRQEGMRIYNADDGPLMNEDGEYKLILRSGRIGFEFLRFPSMVQDEKYSPPYARFGQASILMILRNSNSPILEPPITPARIGLIS